MILRNLALNILRNARPDFPIRRKRKRCGWSDEFAKTVIVQMRQTCDPLPGRLPLQLFRLTSHTLQLVILKALPQG